MNPSSQQLEKLQEMGLGPLWQRRALSAPAGIETVTASEATPAIEDIAAMDWDTLNAAITHCTRCQLCEGRTHAVPGVGDRQARWLFVGEGPGVNEDRQGEPFVGPAGKLLDNMLQAIGIERGANSFITNVVKCRPIDADGRDRPPAAEEVAACMPYLTRQIALIKPDLIVALGKVAAVSLLRITQDTALAGLRGQPHKLGDVPVVVTYHPAYLLRKPADKAKSWQDLCLAKSLFDGR
jgi:DNA polymerase